MEKIKLSIIAAIGKNRELGKDKKMLWHIPEDFKYFKEKTLGHPVIMGQTTHNSIGFILPDRLNIVLTKDKNKKNTTNLVFVDSIKKAIEEARKKEKEEIFIIGGASVYKQFLDRIDKLYLTLINAKFPEANVFFPEYENIFTKEQVVKNGQDKNFNYEFIVLKKK